MLNKNVHYITLEDNFKLLKGCYTPKHFLLDVEPW